jgi:uncharacterized protein YutE (UPF0331/DUF86 family)
MTPPPLDVDACQQKLVLLADLLADLERHGDPTGDELRADRDRRHVIERILTQLVDIAVGLNGLLARALGHRQPTGYRDSFELLGQIGVLPPDLARRLAPAAGMRNLLTHEYGSIDLDVVAAAVPLARRDFGEYVRTVRALLANHLEP